MFGFRSETALFICPVGGQRAFQVQAFPFRMTERNIKLHRGSKWEEFWSELKEGYDLFQRSHLPPLVSVCKGQYLFEAVTLATANGPIEERCPPEVAETP